MNRLELLDSLERKVNTLSKGLHEPKRAVKDNALADIDALRRELSRGWWARLVRWGR